MFLAMATGVAGSTEGPLSSNATSRPLAGPCAQGCDTNHNGEIDFIEFVMWLCRA